MAMIRMWINAMSRGRELSTDKRTRVSSGKAQRRTSGKEVERPETKFTPPSKKWPFRPLWAVAPDCPLSPVHYQTSSLPPSSSSPPPSDLTIHHLCCLARFLRSTSSLWIVCLLPRACVPSLPCRSYTKGLRLQRFLCAFCPGTCATAPPSSDLLRVW